eukprot:jgi/Bigna1/70911/fgenesh1_pg.13_\
MRQENKRKKFRNAPRSAGCDKRILSTSAEIKAGPTASHNDQQKQAVMRRASDHRARNAFRGRLNSKLMELTRADGEKIKFLTKIADEYVCMFADEVVESLIKAILKQTEGRRRYPYICLIDSIVKGMRPPFPYEAKFEPAMYELFVTTYESPTLDPRTKTFSIRPMPHPYNACVKYDCRNKLHRMLQTWEKSKIFKSAYPRIREKIGNPVVEEHVRKRPRIRGKNAKHLEFERLAVLEKKVDQQRPDLKPLFLQIKDSAMQNKPYDVLISKMMKEMQRTRTASRMSIPPPGAGRAFIAPPPRRIPRRSSSLPVRIKLEDMWKREWLKTENKPVIINMHKGSQCKTCGRYYDSQGKLDECLDRHFRQNKQDENRQNRVVSREYYLDTDEWALVDDTTLIKKKDDEKDGEEENAPKKPLQVAADPNQKSCAKCFDEFERVFDAANDQYVYTHATRVAKNDGKVPAKYRNTILCQPCFELFHNPPKLPPPLEKVTDDDESVGNVTPVSTPVVTPKSTSISPLGLANNNGEKRVGAGRKLLASELGVVSDVDKEQSIAAAAAAAPDGEKMEVEEHAGESKHKNEDDNNAKEAENAGGVKKEEVAVPEQTSSTASVAEADAKESKGISSSESASEPSETKSAAAAAVVTHEEKKGAVEEEEENGDAENADILATEGAAADSGNAAPPVSNTAGTVDEEEGAKKEETTGKKLEDHASNEEAAAAPSREKECTTSTVPIETDPKQQKEAGETDEGMDVEK